MNQQQLLTSQSEFRPELQLVARLRVDPKLASEYRRSGSGDDTSILARLIRCNLLKLEGNDKFKAEQYEKAIGLYKRAIDALVGEDFTVPILYGRCDKYDKFDYKERIDLATCANNIAQSHVKLGQLVEALDWFSEAIVVYKSYFLSADVPQFEWMDMKPMVEEWFTGLMKCNLRASQIFLSLGNTGAAAWKAWQCVIIGTEFPNQPSLKSIKDSTNIHKISELRHPDPSLIEKFELSQPTLQVKGSWKKINVARKVPARYGAFSFIWNGHLYMGGGEKGGKSMMETVQLADFWCIDLRKLDKWRKLPDFPFPGIGWYDKTLGMGFKMAVSDDKAWLFVGSKRIYYFDLLAESWNKVMTTCRGAWPYPGNTLTEYCAHVHKRVLYVFGGVHEAAPLGCNVLMALNLETYKWEHISGTTQPKANSWIPDPRERPASWLKPEEERIYILYGDADRVAARMKNMAHAAENMYTLDDFWSYSIPKKTWRREKIRGNAPCPRTEFAGVYNPVLKKAITFGGYHGSLPTALPHSGPPEQQQVFNFTYFADTFVLSDDGRWSQVVTKGFPTYRALMQLNVDEEGKIWLFGGHCPSQFVPSRQPISKAYGDLWQLQLDVPGGDFRITDEEADSETTKFGPYKRCFGCGSLGTWKKCAGSCGGKAFFCDTDCQREAWKDHKNVHKCHKISDK